MAAQTNQDLPVFSLDKALDQVEGEREVLEEMASLFEEFGPDMARAIHQAVAQQDLEEARRSAHSLKGSAASLAGDRLTDLALQMEMAAHDGDLVALEEMIQRLDQEVERLLQELADHLS